MSSLFQHLPLVARCPLCAAVNEPLDATVVSETQSRQLVHLRCSACAHGVLALVQRSSAAAFSIGMLTDCSSGDAARFYRAPRIAEDDVLATHAALNDSVGFLQALRR